MKAIEVRPEVQASEGYQQRDTESAGAETHVHGDFANAGRNDPCPCGSGKKYKKCHGA
jgi:uncharacterized protein YecA (UPF0149 family)